MRVQDPQIAMIEAARLTSTGRLGEATALIQRTLASAPSAGRRSGGVPEGLREWFGRFVPQTRRRPTPPSGAPEVQPRAGTRSGQFLHCSYRSHAGARAYRLYVPSGYRGEPAPLMVMLHGCKQSPEDFAAGTGMNRHAEELTWLAAYPEQSAAANGSQCWNWFRPQDQQRGRGEPALIAGITREVMHDFAVDPRRVYVAGLSAGGAAAAIMRSTYPDLFAAVGIHSGLACGVAQDVPSAFAAMRRGGGRVQPDAAGRGAIVPTIVFHGDQDRTVNPGNAEGVLAQAASGMTLEKIVERNQAPGSRPYTRTRFADRAGAVMLESWLIHGAGHAWSGGSPAGSYTDPQGPDATAEMLRFFRAHAGPSVICNAT